MKKIYNRTFLSLIFIISNACQAPQQIRVSPPLTTTKKTIITPPPQPAYKPKQPSPSSEVNFLITAENKASQQGRKILQTGRKMTLINQEIIRGGCWDYANAVYNRAGYRKNRQVIFKGSKKKGPYADVSLIQSGDFLYYVNHSYNDIEHSAIFVDWINYANKTALMLSYAGERRKTPARYKSYELSNVYRIIRGR
ncbi:MAG: hypothetical protein KAG10_09140 [Methylococcales bacterium]|nr:hypothetical protein [Methylococcales bacterium]